MIVEITSWVPTVAFSQPAIAAHAPPASVARTIETMMCSTGSSPVHEVATHDDDDRADGCTWPLGPDVEEPDSEGEGDRQPGEDQWRSRDQRHL